MSDDEQILERLDRIADLLDRSLPTSEEIIDEIGDAVRSSMPTRDQIREDIFHGVRRAFFDVLEVGTNGGYPWSREELHDAVTAGVREAFTGREDLIARPSD